LQQEGKERFKWDQIGSEKIPAFGFDLSAIRNGHLDLGQHDILLKRMGTYFQLHKNFIYCL
jgi:hypothetical protein